MANTTRIGIIGDFNEKNPANVATNRSMEQAGAALGRSFETAWLPTDQPQEFGRFHGLLSPSSPYKSAEGALRGIRYAREHNIPFIGTCGGFQHLVLEYARNVMGFKDAAHAETDPHASCLFITPLSCSLAGKQMEVNVKPGSKAAAAYQTTRSTEAYYCNFGLNPAYRKQVEIAGLQITGTDQDDEVRIMELPSHPFFLGTLFVPQVKSLDGSLHPLILAFCRAAIRD